MTHLPIPHISELYYMNNLFINSKGIQQFRFKNVLDHLKHALFGFKNIFNSKANSDSLL